MTTRTQLPSGTKHAWLWTQNLDAHFERLYALCSTFPALANLSISPYVDTRTGTALFRVAYRGSAVALRRWADESGLMYVSTESWSRHKTASLDWALVLYRCPKHASSSRSGAAIVLSQQMQIAASAALQRLHIRQSIPRARSSA